MSMYSNRLQPALQNLLQGVVWFFHPRLSSQTTHILADVQRITLNASCMTISCERTEQLDIFCRVTSFTSDFLSFIDVELIRFFHGAIQLHCRKWIWVVIITKHYQKLPSTCRKLILTLVPNLNPDPNPEPFTLIILSFW